MSGAASKAVDQFIIADGSAREAFLNFPPRPDPRRLAWDFVGADLLQFKPHRGHRVPAPKVLAREVSFLPQTRRAMAIALLPFKSPITFAAATLGGLGYLWTFPA